jgi:TRAP-type C4-dicarboxylate transport system permease small subunit
MNLIERTISVMCQVLLWISTVVIFAILVGNTILRYATGASLQWANEVPELLFPWLVMSGVVLAAQHGAHITTSFLIDKMSGAVRRLLGVLGWIVVCVLYGTLTLATWRMLEIVHDEKSPILQIPGSVTYSCVMVGMALLAVLAVMSAWRAWVADPNTPMSTEPAPVHW